MRWNVLTIIKIIFAVFTFLIRVLSGLGRFLLKLCRFCIALIFNKMGTIYKSCLLSIRLNTVALAFNEMAMKFRVFSRDILANIPTFYSDFMNLYAVTFWFRLMMVFAFLPIKFFFNSILYPMFSVYFMSGAAFYVVFSVVCTLIYLSILLPGFWNALRQGDFHIFFLLQVIYFEASLTMPAKIVYADPFWLDAVLVAARMLELDTSSSKTTGGIAALPQALDEIYIEDEDSTYITGVPKYSPLRPVSNPLAPSQLYAVAVEKSYRTYGLENTRFSEYFFKRHLPISWENRAAFVIEMGHYYVSLDGLAPMQRCMVWNSQMEPFSGFADYDPPISPSRYPWYFDDEDEEFDGIDLFEWYWYSYRFAISRGTTISRSGSVANSVLINSPGGVVKKVPSHVCDILAIPGSQNFVSSGPLDSRYFGRILRSLLCSYANTVNLRLARNLNTIFDAPGLAKYAEPYHSGLYLQLRAQQKLDGVHVSPVVLVREYDNTYFFYPGTTLYHSLYTTYSDYQTNKDLKFLETWSAFFSPKYPVISAPLIALDKIFANSRFLGLLVSLDPLYGEKARIGAPRPHVLGSSIYFNKKRGLPNYYSPLQRDFSPTYNFDILEFVNKSSSYYGRRNAFVYFAPGSDINPLDLDFFHSGLSPAEFKILTLYGQRGLIFPHYLGFSYYKNIVDSQWYLFTRDKLYDPLTGRLTWVLGAQTWTWGLSQRWIKDTRLVSLYRSQFGMPFPRRVPYPTRFYIPLSVGEDVSIGADTNLSRYLTLYNRPLFNFEQNYMPYQLDRSSEFDPVYTYAILQNGSYMRRKQDSRFTSDMKFGPLISSFCYDYWFGRELFIFPAPFMRGPMFYEPISYVPRRSFDRFAWPSTLGKDKARLFQVSTYDTRVLDDEQIWDMDEKYILPGYHRNVPRSFITVFNDETVSLHSDYMLASLMHWGFILYDAVKETIVDEIGHSILVLMEKHNRRSLTYLINAQFAWIYNGDSYHDLDLWWYEGLDGEYGRQIAEVRATLYIYWMRRRLSMWWFARPSFLPDPVQERYILWVHGLLQFYFDAVGFEAPTRIHRKCQMAFNASTLNPPVRPLPDEPQYGKGYGNLLPPVIVDLYYIAEEARLILENYKPLAAATPHMRTHIDYCRKKYPARYLFRGVVSLVDDKVGIYDRFGRLYQLRSRLSD